MFKKKGVLLLVIVGLLAAFAAMAQGYPTRPITLMVMYPAGGGTDVGARMVASTAEKYLGQTLTVVNKAGAGGFVGWEELIRKKPDGYTIGFINIPGLTYGYLDPSAGRKMSLGDFTPIMNHVYDPGVIAVRADSRFQNIQELLDYARANPEELTATTTGVGSDDHLAIMQVERGTGAKFNVVHFRGFADTLAATLGGHVDVLFANVGEVKVPQQNGELRTLAVLDDKQTDFLPGVPTLEEATGLPVYSGSARGLAGPAGMSKEMVDVLAEAFKKAMEEPEHIEKMAEIGLPLRFMAGEEYQAYLERQEQVVKELMGW